MAGKGAWRSDTGKEEVPVLQEHLDSILRWYGDSSWPEVDTGEGFPRMICSFQDPKTFVLFQSVTRKLR